MGADTSGKQRSKTSKSMKDEIKKRFAVVSFILTAIAVSACGGGEDGKSGSSLVGYTQGQPKQPGEGKKKLEEERKAEEVKAKRAEAAVRFVQEYQLAGENHGPAKKEGSASHLRAIAIALGVTALGLLLFLVYQMRKRLDDLLVVADENENSELLLLVPLRAELDRLGKNQKTIGKSIKANFGAVQEHLKGTQEAVGQIEEEMQSVRELANQRTKEIGLYQEGIRLSSVKDAMGQVIKGLDFIREAVRVTADGGEEARNLFADHLEPILREALLSAGVDEYGEEVIGEPIEDHRKHCKAIPNESAVPEHGPGIITSVKRMGYRVLVKPNGEYFILRVAEVTVNPSAEKEQSAGGEDLGNNQERAL